MPDLGNWGQYGVLRDDVPYGQHIALRCKHHPNLRWSTKNIAPIGARSIFYSSWPEPECSCSGDDLEVVMPDIRNAQHRVALVAAVNRGE